MKSLSLTAFIASALLSLCACQPDKKADFAVITQRNTNAQLIGEEDLTDWTNIENWTSKEKSLFNGISTFNFNVDPDPTLDIIAYQNPTPGFLYLYFQNLNNESTIFYTIVDNQYKKMTTGKIVGSPAFVLDLGTFLSKKGNYRMYYLIRKDNQFIANGHGDIKYI